MIRVLVAIVFLIAAVAMMAWSMKGIRDRNQNEFRMSDDWAARERRRERDGRP